MKSELNPLEQGLLQALKLYVKLDNDRRSGCEVADSDWAECYQLAGRAIYFAKEMEKPMGPIPLSKYRKARKRKPAERGER